jgi:hypothetical protein
MTPDRPAAQLRPTADRERQLVRKVQETEWLRRMLRAGHIDADQLSNHAHGILAWLAEWDDWTVDGVAELLTAAHRAGQEAARASPDHDESAIPVDAEDGPLDAPPEDELAGAATTAATGTQPLPTPAGYEPISARLAALQQRPPETPAVGL